MACAALLLGSLAAAAPVGAPAGLSAGFGGPVDILGAVLAVAVLAGSMVLRARRRGTVRDQAQPEPTNEPAPSDVQPEAEVA
jgi:hypothetical protein